MTRHSLVRRLILAIFLRSCQAREAAPLIKNRRYFNNTIVYHTRPFITVLETIEITRSLIEITARFHYTLRTKEFPPRRSFSTRPVQQIAALSAAQTFTVGGRPNTQHASLMMKYVYLTTHPY